MFYWCWVGTSIYTKFNSNDTELVGNFAIITLSLYYFWHFAFLIFSVCVLIAAFWILRGHLAASSETRKFVLIQNFIYVLVLGIETSLIMPIWIIQLVVTKVDVNKRRPHEFNEYYPYYFSYRDLGWPFYLQSFTAQEGLLIL